MIYIAKNGQKQLFPFRCAHLHTFCTQEHVGGTVRGILLSPYLHCFEAEANGRQMYMGSLSQPVKTI